MHVYAHGWCGPVPAAQPHLLHLQDTEGAVVAPVGTFVTPVSTLTYGCLMHHKRAHCACCARKVLGGFRALAPGFSASCRAARGVQHVKQAATLLH